MTALALDLGATLGWARGATVGPIEYGSIPMPNTTKLGPYLAEMDACLPKLMVGVKTIAVEQPFMSDSYWVIRKLCAQLGMVYYHAHHLGISSDYIEEIAVPTAKHTMAGHGRADKDQMIAAACEFWGLEADETDEHSADASAILRVHLFGRRQAIRKPKTRSSKGVVIAPFNHGEKL